jgi:heptosyltransferase I
MKHSHKILIIRLSSLGDVLHTLPAFENLKSSFPDAQIDWLASLKSEQLLSSIRGINVLHTIDTAGLLKIPPDLSSWKKAFDLIRILRQQHYDIAIDFQGLLKTAIICSFSGSRRRLGFSGKLVRERPADLLYHLTLEKPVIPVHVSVLNQMLAALAGAHRAPADHDFIVSDSDVDFVHDRLTKEGLKDFIVFNPGGGWRTKRWHLERFGELAEKTGMKLGVPVVVTTGPGEESYHDIIVNNSGGAAVHHFPVSILQLIPLLKKARLFVGGDTGPFHLACALETPVVGIFGPTSPLRNGLWNTTGEIVTNGHPCSPCYGRTCPTATECMDIPVDTVFSAIQRRLEK